MSGRKAKIRDKKKKDEKEMLKQRKVRHFKNKRKWLKNLN